MFKSLCLSFKTRLYEPPKPHLSTLILRLPSHQNCEINVCCLKQTTTIKTRLYKELLYLAKTPFFKDFRVM